MKIFIRIWWGLIAAFAAFCIFGWVAEGYMNNMKATGALITASEILEAQALPYIMAVFAFCAVVKFKD
jgi:hypothetical protein